MPKKTKKRDMQASSRTLAYFLTTRLGKPTTVQQAAKALRIDPDRIANMASGFVKEGKLARIHRGVYSKPIESVRLVPDGDKELLGLLLKEREHLDAQIEKVRSVIEMKRQRKGK